MAMSDVVTSGVSGIGGQFGDTSGFIGTSGGGSGIFPGSGASGLFLETKQSMTITYARVPEGALNNHELTLSSYTPSSYYYQNGIPYPLSPIAQTYLAYTIDAQYTQTKVFGSFSSMSYTQPQKFAIVGASGAGGLGYGGGLSGNNMGVAGQVITTQQFYNRRPFQDDDVEITKTMKGANVAYLTSSINALGTNGSWIHDQSLMINNYESHFCGGWRKYSPVGFDFGGITAGLFGINQPFALHWAGRDYQLNGPYNVSQEYGKAQVVWNLLDEAGRRIKASRFVARPPTNSENKTTIQAADFVGIPEYSETRHDYS